MSTITSPRSSAAPINRPRTANRNRAASGRFVVHPPAGPRGGLDLTERVVSIIADELWKRNGGNDVLNWIEAERLLVQALLAGATTKRNSIRVAAND